MKHSIKDGIGIYKIGTAIDSEELDILHALHSKKQLTCLQELTRLGYHSTSGVNFWEYLITIKLPKLSGKKEQPTPPSYKTYNQPGYEVLSSVSQRERLWKGVDLPTMQDIDTRYGWQNPVDFQNDLSMSGWDFNDLTQGKSTAVAGPYGQDVSDDFSYPFNHFILCNINNDRYIDKWQRLYFTSIRGAFNWDHEEYVYCPITKAQHRDILSLISGIEQHSPFIGLFDL